MAALREFLQRNSVQASACLPLVHSTHAYALLSILKDEEIQTTECAIFKEKLNYYFVGRPAYKFPNNEEEAQEWELPCCFIFEFSSIENVKRVYPFDSGAFSGGRFPKYISMMDREKFEVSGVANAPEKIVGAFFGTAKRYMMMRPKDRDAFEAEFSLTVRDPEAKAAHTLAMQTPAARFDDRRFTIEVQSEQSLDLKISRPIAVVLPSIYLDDYDVRETIVKRWGAEPLTYSIASLNVNSYYGQIYELIYRYYDQAGML
jgi:hypothetical protein